ncbi:MAG: hypothetical protein JJE49_07325 [Peptostreptococcaceae bacterium]|nr:hypothetical protein [Peptostreptococcaceae bacterium]
MQQKKQYWDDIIKNLDPAESSYDGWLDKYNLELLESRQFIVELGCGWGMTLDIWLIYLRGFLVAIFLMRRLRKYVSITLW